MGSAGWTRSRRIVASLVVVMIAFAAGLSPAGCGVWSGGARGRVVGRSRAVDSGRRPGGASARSGRIGTSHGVPASGRARGTDAAGTGGARDRTGRRGRVPWGERDADRCRAGGRGGRECRSGGRGPRRHGGGARGRGRVRVPPVARDRRRGSVEAAPEPVDRLLGVRRALRGGVHGPAASCHGSRVCIDRPRARGLRDRRNAAWPSRSGLPARVRRWV